MRPMIAIVGRPNVGKSTLLNRLAGRRVAVVEDEPGVTRDRLFVDCRLGDHEVVLVDTGGLDFDPEDEVARGAVEKAHLAVEESELVLFLADARDGVHPLDHQVADVLRRSGKPFVCLVNKCDPGSNRDPLEFHELGLPFLPISATHGAGLADLSALVGEQLDQAGFSRVAQAAGAEGDPVQEAAERPLRLCLLGRPNVGKSSLANRLAGAERQLVSAKAGTTRDAVDIAIEAGGRSYLLVDTPGVRRRGRISQRVERYGVVAAFRSLERADVAVVVIDGSEPFSDQDARLLSLSHDRGRSLVVAVNKCDLWDAQARKSYLADLEHQLRFVPYAPVLPLSARTGRAVDRLLPEVAKVWAAAAERISTGDLNRLLERALQRQLPPVIKGRRGKVFYAAQAGIRPPTFVIWVNDPDRFPTAYRRYLDHQLRARNAFQGTPLQLVFRERGSTAPGPAGGGEGRARRKATGAGRKAGREKGKKAAKPGRGRGGKGRADKRAKARPRSRRTR